MGYTNFEDFLKTKYSTTGSGACSSYLRAIQIIDNCFRENDSFGLQGQSIKQIEDPYLIERIIEYVVEEENKFRKGESSIFDSMHYGQTSYPQNRFCTAAVRQLGNYVKDKYFERVFEEVRKPKMSASKISSYLNKEFEIDKIGREIEVEVKMRIGQDFFRTLLLSIYSGRCCLTGLDVPEVLRASHIIPWSKDKKARLNPQNGLILSATYDAAFDRYLISFDEDYRMIISPVIKDAYSSKAFKEYFKDMEGKKIELPQKFWPSQEFLAVHREEMSHHK